MNVKARYVMGNNNANSICYADNAVLIANWETNNTTAKLYNMEISTKKTNCIVVLKNSIWSKLEVDGTIVKQVIPFKYLVVDIICNSDILETDERWQLSKNVQGYGTPNSNIWYRK